MVYYILDGKISDSRSLEMVSIVLMCGLYFEKHQMIEEYKESFITNRKIKMNENDKRKC